MLLKKLQKDCLVHGYGRKKWWADQLGIPPLTLSHWLAGRQQPNGNHALMIQEVLQENEKKYDGVVWKNYLWDTYYLGEKVPAKILPLIILNVLSLPTIDTRTLALLSRFVEKYHPIFETPLSAQNNNRLGWLIEISGQKAQFKPEQRRHNREILPLTSRSKAFRHYLEKQQTPLGKKWHLFDCPLDTTKASLP